MALRKAPVVRMKPDRNKLSGSGAVRAGNNQRIAYAKGTSSSNKFGSQPSMAGSLSRRICRGRRGRPKGIFRSPKRSFAESVEFPRWILAAGVLLIGLMLLVATLADDSGKLNTPGTASVLYLTALIGIAAALIYSDRVRRSPEAGRISAPSFLKDHARRKPRIFPPAPVDGPIFRRKRRSRKP